MEQENRKTSINTLRIFIIVSLIIGVAFVGYFGLSISNKLTYIETKSMNIQKDTYVSVNSKEETIQQSFQMPYELFSGVDILINNYDRDNNSNWLIQLIDKEKGKVVYSWNINASQIHETEDYYEFKTKKPIPVKYLGEYEVSIQSTNANAMTSLAFGASQESGDLCFQVEGGTRDTFWTVLYWGMILAVVALVFATITFKKEKKILQSAALQAIVLAVLYFLFACIWVRTTAGTFIDESDNMLGGMIIAKGGVLYRDYVTSHTPLAYYICALFAKLGAGSIEQFRILYDILLSVIWALVYLRYSSLFDKKKLFVLPFVELFLTVAMGGEVHAFQLLSDVFEATALVILFLEFLYYTKEKTLGWKRVSIVSATMWTAVGAAFVSVYAIIFVVLAVVICEVMEWKKQKDITIVKFMKRYAKLGTALVVPGIITIIYFAYHGALRAAYELAFTFNRTIYAEYINGYGKSIIRPFITGVKTVVGVVPDNLQILLSGQDISKSVIQIAIWCGVLYVCCKLWKEKEYLLLIVVIGVLVGLSTRGYVGAHGLPMWYVAIALGVIFINWCVTSKGSLFLTMLVGMFASVPFVTQADTALFSEAEKVNKNEMAVVDLTQPGEKIFIGGYSKDTMYLLYKNRYPVNRSLFMLPWYLDEFEMETIASIEQSKPQVAYFTDDSEAWGITDYYPCLTLYMQEQYNQKPDTYYVWTRR